MKKRNDVVRIGFGSSSLLLVFVVISFVSFAVLSLSSALTDRNLTAKIYEKNLSYYDACNLAEEQLSQIDTLLENAYLNSSSPEEFYEKVSAETTFTIPVSEFQELSVTVSHHYPEDEGDTLYDVTGFQLFNHHTPAIESDLPVFQ